MLLLNFVRNRNSSSADYHNLTPSAEIRQSLINMLPGLGVKVDEEFYVTCKTSPSGLSFLKSAPAIMQVFHHIVIRAEDILRRLSFVNTFFYVRREDGGGTPFYKMVEEKDDEWEKVTNLAKLPENVPGVIFSERRDGEKGDKPMVMIFPGHASTYVFSADVNGHLKHGVKSRVNVQGMPMHLHFKPLSVRKRKRC